MLGEVVLGETVLRIRINALLFSKPSFFYICEGENGLARENRFSASKPLCAALVHLGEGGQPRDTQL